MPKNRYYSGPVSENFDGVRFRSPGQPLPDRSLRDVLKWQRSGQRAVWPKTVSVSPDRPPESSSAPRVTMVGHATVLIQIAGLNILTDPVWSDRASPVQFAGPRRVTAPGIAFDDLPPIHVVLISHNHYDHLDTRTLQRLHARHRPKMVMPLGNDATVRGKISDAVIATGDWHQRVRLPNDVDVTLTPSHHWSSRGIRDRRMALWSGFWLHSAQGNIWFAGDTGYGDGAIFHDMRARYGAPDIALIPIGAYEPRWFMSDQHVAPEESVQIFKDIGAQQALGFHWGTFQLTDEPREEPKTLLRHVLTSEGIEHARFIPMEPGDVYDGT